MPEVQSLNAAVALVTGASRGIGRAIALQLARHGAIVIGTATTSDGAQRISEAFAAEALQGRGLALDVRDQASIDAVLSDIEAREGTPAILVNNAGITRDNLLLRMKAEEWQDILDTNLSSAFRLSKACLRGMMKQRAGRIVNIASIVGLTGNAGQTNYVAAKAGMIGFTKALAREVGSRNITVNSVAPGFIETDMTRALTEEQRKKLTEQIALGRLGTPDDVAAAVLFLVSPAAGYITGDTLHVNGGMYMP